MLPLRLCLLGTPFPSCDCFLLAGLISYQGGWALVGMDMETWLEGEGVHTPLHLGLGLLL